MRRIVLVQLLLFAATALIVVPYGIYYIVGSSLGERMRVTALVDDALGVGEGTVVTYRGVRIGTVASVQIAPLDGGARIELDLDTDSEVPVDSYAKITQGTLAGMLNVDIFPRADGGPYLTDGDTIDMPADEQPVQIGETLAQAAELLGSVEPGTIATVGAELGSAFEGLGPDLARLIGDVDRISAGLEADVGGIADLLTRSIDLTATMAANSTQFVEGMASARRLAESLHANEDRVSSMLATTPDAMRRADGVLAENEESFAAIVANLDSVAPIISDRSSALAAGLVAIPRGLAALESIVHGDRADFALIATQGPVCFYDTPRRAVGDTSPVTPSTANYCPPGQDLAQRGAMNAPRPDDLGLAGSTTPGTVIGPPVVADPILVPSGAELQAFWRMLWEGVNDGAR
ncbi:MAG: MCE family protein [Rhodococcus sp.]|uniref:MCE family protein n=1 Tax=Rhodococcus sp. TaxID=1831 RepID=UPI00169E9565|nr:MlaD family protein [Rhodococcus sp. (in: high G+C Gram-positive bacteria)]NLV81200.1 MCE family protein [Rhodococcus sp. (in: high G+C Gram-positive bacteria)]